MLISEIFYSIQGEGELCGVPSVFIRTSGCNLRCRWCDTPYASWNPQGEEMQVQEILEVAQSHPTRHCVLTGGEPMIARDVHHLASALREAGFHITIETAGTVAPEGIACDLASISPKLANSTPRPGEAGEAWIARHEATRTANLRAWAEAYPFQIKFVFTGPDDLEEIEATIASCRDLIPPHKVLLMPEGTSEAVLDGRRAALLQACLQCGYRLCDRLHIRFFGNTRGT